MAAQAPSDKIKDKDYINYQKLTLALYYLKHGLYPFIEKEIQFLHQALLLQIYGNQMKPQPLCCNAGLCEWNKATGNWELPVKKHCKSKCGQWFKKLLEYHSKSKSENIYWTNSDMSLWPSKPWECAKVFMPCELKRFTAGPDECNTEELMLLLATCNHFLHKLSSQGHGLLRRISSIRDKVMQDDEIKLSDGDKKVFIDEIIQLLEDQVMLKEIDTCKTAVVNIRKIDFMEPSEMHLLLQDHNSKRQREKPDLPAYISQENDAYPLIGAIGGQSPSMHENKVVPTSQKREVCIPFNPRCHINKWTAEYIESCIVKEIEGGAFGTVYESSIKLDLKMPDGKKLEFVIKRIPITDEVNRRSYEKEIDHGKILHPFINPVFARAERLQSPSKEGYLYLVFPLMKNKDLRHNINNENNNIPMEKDEIESNSKIWTRCIYQIVLTVDYLHTNLRPFRGQVFHRDLTSKNILLDENFNIRIGDFGIAVEAKMNNSKATVTHKLGTKGYHPPHMDDEKYNASYDTFSIGVVMLEILTGEMPKVQNGNRTKYLYNKFANMGELKRHLDGRAKKNDTARWRSLDDRDTLAELALEAVSLDDTKRKAVKLLQKLEALILDANQRYRSPKYPDVCASCCANPTVKLPLKGKGCLEKEKTDPCQPFCIQCLMNYPANPLVCPKHGGTRPPFGDHVYGVFVAGNHFKEMQGTVNDELDGKSIAGIFESDVAKVVKALTAMDLFISANRKDHFKIVTPNCSGTEKTMMTRIRESFEDLDEIIKMALVERQMKPEDRLPSSLFIFYFSGHCSAEDGLYLGSKGEKISVSTTWIMEMLHLKLGVDQVLVILDCCHADSHNFVNTEDLNIDTSSEHSRQKVRIIQISSCDKHETSQAKFQDKNSSFTKFLCRGLKGLYTTRSKNDVRCDSCKKKNKTNEDACMWYQTQCSKDQTITLPHLVQFIRSHLQLKMTPVNNSQGEINVYLGYYNPDQSIIHIRLSASEGEHGFDLRKPYPEKIETLKQVIINHTVKKKITCDVLSFHESYIQACGETNTENSEDATENTSRVIGIYAKYNNNTDMDMELNSVHRIYNAWASGLELEARVREKIEDLCHGFVKVDKITRDMVKNLDVIDTDSLKLSSDTMEIPTDKIAEAEGEIEHLFRDHKDFTYRMVEVLATCRESLSINHKKDKRLQILVYKNFSVFKLI